MKANLIKGLYPVIFITLVIIIMTSVLCFTGCNSLVLSDEPETVELLQKVFTEAVYYNYDEEAEIYTVYNAGRKKIGYAFYAEGKGWGGNMVILVGLWDKEAIKGITVISHNEVLNTGGEYGEPLHFGTFSEQFIGLKIEEFSGKG